MPTNNRLESHIFKFYLLILGALPFSPIIITMLGSIIGTNRFLASWKELLLYPLAVYVVIVYRVRFLQMLRTERFVQLGTAYVAFLFTDLVLRGINITSLAGFAYNSRFILVFFMGIALAGYIVKSNVNQWLKRVLATLLIVGVGMLFIPSSLLAKLGYDTGASNRINSPQAAYYISPELHIPRMMSTTKGPNSLGLALLVIFGVTLYSRDTRKKLWLILSGAGIILTFSRSALLGLLLICAYWAWFHRAKLQRYRNSMTAIFMVCVSIVVVLISTESGRSLLLHQQSGDINGSTSIRGSETLRTIKMVAHTPFGEGQGTASLAGRVSGQQIVISENYYLQVARETGWIGSVLFVAFYCAVFIAAAHLPYAKKHLARSLLLAFAVACVFLPIWSEELVSMWFWAVMGIIFGSNYSSRSKKMVK